MTKSRKIKILFCVNDRGEGRRSCAASDANALRKYARAKAADNDQVQVKKSGCLGLCKHGPVLQVLPAKLYYRCASEADIDQLFAQQVDQGQVASTLLVRTGKTEKKK